MMKQFPKSLQNLSNSGSLTEILHHAEKLNQLDQWLKQNITKELATHIKVVNFRQGILYIAIDSAVWAARFNFQKSQIIQDLRTKHMPMLSAIELKVNPQMLKTQVNKPTNNNQLSPKAAAHIEELANQIGGPLAEKLKRLASKASR
ncbi:DUF721 domain-containing protein [Paraferrimonas sp. SM1919]|uniref:DUF721 domain-containing protein n=1 Tax=Paraferrimonas sp. SM1919 TaxID=2662263 RepID=UPI0013D54C3F|nr:DciA family protein [Paraferrimonas sp. SM1919]